MAVKNGFVVTSVATSFMFCLPSQVQAQKINSYEDYQLDCSPKAYQSDVQSPYCRQDEGLDPNRFPPELSPQEIRRRDSPPESNRARPANRVKAYVGGSLGVFFPTNESENLRTVIDFVLGTNDFVDNLAPDLEPGFGGSLFAGVKLNQNWATDLEFTLLGGDTEIEDTSYSQWGIFLNPRFILPLSHQQNSVAIFLSPGIGISKGKVSYDLPDSVAQFLGIEENLGLSLEDAPSLAWQIKLGLDFPFEGRYKGFAQVRYVNPTGSNTIDLVSTELGFAVEF